MMYSYLSYRILNKLFSMVSVKRARPLVYTKGVNHFSSHRILFDFSDSNTHLGDRLFFLPLISFLVSSGYDAFFSERDAITKGFFTSIIGEFPSHSTSCAGHGDIVVLTMPSLFAMRKQYRSCICVDFSDISSQEIITRQLIDSMSRLLDLDAGTMGFNMPVLEAHRCPLLEDGGHEYYIFSNYIDSGGFRKLFVNEDLLYRKAINLKKQGFKILHVGSVRDKAVDTKRYDFVDVDLRGSLQLSDLPALVRDPRVAGVISYDNVWMHLAGIFNKESWILFRGRLNRKLYAHHMRFVNNTFFNDAGLLHYLH